jgi:hypothetical protein
MMGNRGATNGDEFEAFSRRYRHLIHWKRGQLRMIKRRFSKRIRRDARSLMRKIQDA